MSQGNANPFGKDIDAAVMPTGGRGVRGWLSAIFDAMAQASSFTKIKRDLYRDDEQVLYDVPSPPASAKMYSGFANESATTAQTVWDIVRTTYDANGNPASEGIALGIAWDDRVTETYTDD